MDVIRGIDDQLAPYDFSLLVQVVASPDDEVDTLNRWHRDGAVAGVVIGDVVPDDLRLTLLRDKGVPTVVMARPEDAPGLPTVAADNVGTMERAVRFLAEDGHKVIGRVAGPSAYVHTQLRTRAFEEAGRRAGITPVNRQADFTADAGARATADLLDASPTAVLFDNDVMALAGLEVLTSRGLRVPDDVALLSWDDSLHCELSKPSITAFNHDLPRMGRAIANALLRVLGGDADVHEVLPAPRLVERASTGMPRVTRVRPSS